MPKLLIDNREVEVAPGATILDAARKLGIAIPTLCHLDGHAGATSCSVCLVRVNGATRLAPSCATPAVDGMRVESETPDIHVARRTALELLLSEHQGDCYAPCMTVCPAGVDIPAMLRRLAGGQLREAAQIARAAHPFPAVLGRICSAPCEKGCRRAQRDSAVGICLAERFVGDAALTADDPCLPQCQPDTGKRVAIVGSGCAGLTAAYFLRQAGHACTVIDRHHEPGGKLRMLADDELPQSVLAGEIAWLMRLGITFEPGKMVSSIAPLREEYDAILVTTGEGTLETLLPGIAVDSQTSATTTPGVFAAGAAVTPTHQAIRAMTDGHAAAESITQFLSGEQCVGLHRQFSVHIGRMTPAELEVAMQGVSEAPRVHADRSAGYTGDEAAREAARCLHCDCRTRSRCKLHRYGAEYDARPTQFKGERRVFARDHSHPAVLFEPGRCISCGLCVQIATAAQEPLGLTFIGRGFDVRVGVPFFENLSAGLQQLARECALACPTGALALHNEGE